MFAAEQMHGKITFRQQRVGQKSIAAEDHVFSTQIDHSHIPIHSGTAGNLFAIVLTLEVIQFNTFAHIRHI